MWPSQRPDLNLIEVQWHHLKQAIEAKLPKNIHELEQSCIEECTKICPDCHRGLFSSYREPSGEVSANKGGSTTQLKKEFLCFFYYTIGHLKNVFSKDAERENVLVIS